MTRSQRSDSDALCSPRHLPLLGVVSLAFSGAMCYLLSRVQDSHRTLPALSWGIQCLSFRGDLEPRILLPQLSPICALPLIPFQESWIFQLLTGLESSPNTHLHTRQLLSALRVSHNSPPLLSKTLYFIHPWGLRWVPLGDNLGLDEQG